MRYYFSERKAFYWTQTNCTKSLVLQDVLNQLATKDFHFTLHNHVLFHLDSLVNLYYDRERAEEQSSMKETFIGSSHKEGTSTSFYHLSYGDLALCPESSFSFWCFIQTFLRHRIASNILQSNKNTLWQSDFLLYLNKSHEAVRRLFFNSKHKEQAGSKSGNLIRQFLSISSPVAGFVPRWSGEIFLRTPRIVSSFSRSLSLLQFSVSSTLACLFYSFGSLIELF